MLPRDQDSLEVFSKCLGNKRLETKTTQKCSRGTLWPRQPRNVLEVPQDHDQDCRGQQGWALAQYHIISVAEITNWLHVSLQELVGLINVNRETHKLLSKYLHLDDFSSLFCEANNSVSAPYGRIPLYMLLELSVHFLPHYCYNDATGRYWLNFIMACTTTTTTTTTTTDYHADTSSLNFYRPDAFPDAQCQSTVIWEI